MFDFLGAWVLEVDKMINDKMIYLCSESGWVCVRGECRIFNVQAYVHVSSSSAQHGHCHFFDMDDCA